MPLCCCLLALALVFFRVRVLVRVHTPLTTLQPTCLYLYCHFPGTGISICTYVSQSISTCIYLNVCKSEKLIYLHGGELRRSSGSSLESSLLWEEALTSLVAYAERGSSLTNDCDAPEVSPITLTLPLRPLKPCTYTYAWSYTSCVRSTYEVYE